MNFKDNNIILQNISLLLLLLTANVAFAQESITNGDSRTGTISIVSDVDHWTFNASSGDNLIIQIAELSGTSTFEPLIRLLDPNANLVSSNWGTFSADIVVQAPLSGTYTIEVLDASSIPNGTGSYELFLFKSTSNFLVPSGDEGGLIGNGTNNNGVISLADIDIWTFDVSALETIHLQVAETIDNGGFEPEIRLFNPVGDLVASNWGFTASDIIYQATIGGTYTAVVREATQDVPSTGSYTLFITATGRAFNIPSGDEGGSLSSGDVHTGSISLGDVDIWEFNADAADTVLIQAAETLDNGGFEPEIRLYDPQGNLVTSNWGFTATDLRVQLSVAGNYSVVVREATQDVPSTGDYELFFTNTTDIQSIPIADEGGPLSNGSIHSGAISLADIDAWTFTAAELDTVIIQVGETADDGGFEPEISLYGPRGDLITSNWGTTAADLVVSLTEGGNYTVIVKEASQDVPSTGTYELFFTNTAEPLTVDSGDEGGHLTNGGIHTGTISLGDVDAWTFSASALDTALIQVGETVDNGGFDPEIRLYDPQGELVASNWGSTASDLAVTLSKGGNYTVLVREASADVPSTGSYQLFFQKAADSFTVSAGDQGGPLASGATEAGDITLGDFDAWTMTVNAQDQIDLTLTEVTDNGGFDPSLRLYDPLGQLVASSWGATGTSISHTANLAGAYTAIVREQTGDVPNTGSYTLNNQITPASITVPSGSIIANLNSGALLNATISGSSDTDKYNLAVSAGEIVRISMGDLNATNSFYPQVQVFNASGNLIASGTSNGSANILFKAPTSETLTVVLSNSAISTSTFNYEVSVAVASQAVQVSGGDQGGILNNGELTSGNLRSGDLDVYELTVVSGETVRISAGDLSASNSFYPEIQVLDSAGAIIGTAVGNGAANLLFKAPANDSLRVVLFNSVSTSSTFNYEISAALSSQAITTLQTDQGGALTNGTLISGTMRSGDLDVYQLPVTAGELVKLTLGDTSSSNTFYPELNLLNEQGQLLKSAVGNGAAHISFVAPNTESLTVVAFNSVLSSSQFNYQLSAAIASQSINTNSNDEGGVINNGKVTTGVLSSGDIDQYDLSVDAGNTVSVRIGDTSSSNSFYPQIYILSSAGNLLATNVNNSAATVSFETSVADTLRIVVANNILSSATFTYELSAAVAAAAYTTASNDEGDRLEDGVLATGIISHGDFDLYVFSALKGETINVLAEDTSISNSFYPSIRVYRSTGELIAAANSNTTVNLNIPVPAQDVYFLVLENALASAGNFSYNLSVSGMTDNINSDVDSLVDATEFMLGTNRLSEDTDNDGLTDDQEVNVHNTDPLDQDTDGDGFNDSQEVATGSDPRDANAIPEAEEDIPLPFWALMLLGAFFIYSQKWFGQKQTSTKA